MKSYKIVRTYYKDGKENQLMKSGMSLKDARKHCKDESTECGLEETTDSDKWFFDFYTLENRE